MHLNGSWIETAAIDVGNKKPTNQSKYIGKPAKVNSNNAAENESTLTQLLSKVGSKNIGEGMGPRFKYELSMANAMTTLCGALIILDPKKIPESGEFLQRDIASTIHSYFINSAPLKLNLSGHSIDEQIEYDNSTAVGATASFPLAGNFDLNISGADYYKVKFQAKHAGWAILEHVNGTTYAERISGLSDPRKEAIAQQIMATLEKCPSCAIYPVDQVFYYESLTASTTKYNRIQGSVSASVSSVVTGKGAYKRDESQDLTSSRGSTIIYYGLGGDITTPIKKLTEGILQLAAVRQLTGNPVPISLVQSELQKNLNSSILFEQNEGKKIESKPAQEYLDKVFLDQIKTLNAAQLNKLSSDIKAKVSL